MSKVKANDVTSNDLKEVYGRITKFSAELEEIMQSYISLIYEVSEVERSIYRRVGKKGVYSVDFTGNSIGEKHYCTGERTNGYSDIFCFEDNGKLVISNGQYRNVVNYCPFCGAE